MFKSIKPSWQGVSVMTLLVAPLLLLIDEFVVQSHASEPDLGAAAPGGARTLPATSPSANPASASSFLSDPGPRPGPPGAGGPALRPGQKLTAHEASTACIKGLAPAMLALCQRAYVRFQEVDSVSGSIPGEEGAGLGPTFSGNSCAMCHASPAILGGSPSLSSPQNPAPNPQLALATLHGAQNVVPPFITEGGPAREVLFKSDGQIHALYTIAGRRDARGCTQQQPDFAEQLKRDNLSFRIPLSLFGLGLVEALSEATLQSNLAASSNADLGISGTFNTSGSEGTISRFGWKAQNKSLLVFAGEAYSTEMGVSNELFPQERNAKQGCVLNGIPEDATNPTRTGFAWDTNSDIQSFAFAIRLSAPPRPAPPPGATRGELENGERQFMRLGCAFCHTAALTTSTSNLDPALSEVTIHAFSDFALHHMGSGLADGIQQGGAGPDQFRTTPLWGLGQRVFLLHDGRTTDLVTAIAAHSSSGSEASAVIANFQNASLPDRRDVLLFLRSL